MARYRKSSVDVGYKPTSYVGTRPVMMMPPSRDLPPSGYPPLLGKAGWGELQGLAEMPVAGFTGNASNLDYLRSHSATSGLASIAPVADPSKMAKLSTPKGKKPAKTERGSSTPYSPPTTRNKAKQKGADTSSKPPFLPPSPSKGF